MMSYSRIAIIGVGIAGLACATVLRQAGFQLTLFDKSRGAGGRMNTRRGAGWQCDHGAQYFTARNPEFRNLVLHTGMAISALRREDSAWRLHVQDEGPLAHRYDMVVLAVPLLGQVAPLQAALAAGTSMAGCWAMMLDYAAPLALGFNAAFLNSGPLRWVVGTRLAIGFGITFALTILLTGLAMNRVGSIDQTLSRVTADPEGSRNTSHVAIKAPLSRAAFKPAVSRMALGRSRWAKK